MTEAEWWFCVDPSKMLAPLEREQRGRKMRLFAVACCFRIGHLITDPRSQRAVHVAEQYADGRAAEQERGEAEVAANVCYEEQGHGFFQLSIDIGFPRWHGPIIPLATRMAIFSARSAANAARCAIGERSLSATPLNASAALAQEAVLAVHALNPFDMPDDPNDPAPLPEAERFLEVYNAAKDAEAVSQCRLLRDIFGDPFRPRPTLACLGCLQVSHLAQAIYERRTFTDLPILADAVEEAGCADDAILSHLRSPGPHVRGCWVVDLILGRE